MDYDRLRAIIEHRLLRFERFKQHIVSPRLALRQYYWETDPHFELDSHLHRIALPAPGQVAGAEVYRYAVQHIWWTYPLYLFSVTPGLRRLWDWGYRTFRDNRHDFSTACGLPAPAARETEASSSAT